MSLTKEQLETRRRGISSSDIPAILGMDPFGKGPFQVWLEKVHPEEVKPKEGVELDAGTRLEPAIAQWCADLYEPHGLSGNKATLSHSSSEWMLCTPDYFGKHHEPWEIKAWVKDPGDYVEAQVRWQIAVLDKPRGHIGWWNRAGYKEPEHRIIERDLEAEGLMVEAARDFWFGYCLTKKEPPVDASEACGQWFAKQKISQEHLSVDEHHEITKAVQAYRLSTDQVAVANELHTRNGNVLKSLCRELKKVSGPFGSFSYPFHKGKQSVNWEYIARFIATKHGVSEAEFTELIKQNTKVGEAYRQIHPNWSAP